MARTITRKVSTAGAAIYTVPLDKHAEITTLRFTSPVAYNLEVYIETKPNVQRSLIYKLELDAGDTVSDSSLYTLNPGESLYAISSTGQTVCTVVLNEA